MAVLMLVAATVSAQSRASVPAAEVNGTYEKSFAGKYREFSNEIKILALGGGKLRVAMELVYPYTMSNGEAMVNIGELDEVIPIKGDTATYLSDDKECRITIRFVKAGTIRVEEDSREAACGFGHNVSAHGTYRKISSVKPKFETPR